MTYIEERNRFSVIDEHHQEIGEITWSQSEKLMIIDHTFVNSNYRGQKIANALVYHVVEKARRDDLKIIPLCPFAKREFELKTEYHDVLKK